MVSTLLGGKVRLFVPSCAMRELRDLAKQDKTYSAAVSLARKFLRHKDACAPTESTHEILLKQVGSASRCPVLMIAELVNVCVVACHHRVT